MLASGMDHADFYIAHMPRPTIILSQKNDFFGTRGALATYNELKRYYTILGKPENLQIFIGPRDHGYYKENREAMYGFFTRHAGLKPDPREPKVILNKPEDLWAAPKGQVHYLRGKRVFDFTREEAEQVREKRKEVPAAKLPDLIAKLLKVDRRPEVPYYRHMNARPGLSAQGGSHSTVAVETEATGVRAILHMIPKTGQLWHLPEGRRDRSICPASFQRAGYPQGPGTEAARSAHGRGRARHGAEPVAGLQR